MWGCEMYLCDPITSTIMDIPRKVAPRGFPMWRRATSSSVEVLVCWVEIVWVKWGDVLGEPGGLCVEFSLWDY